MGSRSVSRHPTQANAPRLNPSQVGRYSIYLPQRDGRLSWPWWMVIYWNRLAVRRQLKARLHDPKSNVLSVIPPIHVHDVQKLSQFSVEMFYKHERRSQRRFTNSAKKWVLEISMLPLNNPPKWRFCILFCIFGRKFSDKKNIFRQADI